MASPFDYPDDHIDPIIIDEIDPAAKLDELFDRLRARWQEIQRQREEAELERVVRGDK